MGYNLYINAWYCDDNISVFTMDNDYAYNEADDIMYVTDNIGSSGFIYGIDKDNNVVKLFATDQYASSTFCDEIIYSDGSLYGVILGETNVNNEKKYAYLIIQIDEKTMEVIGHTNWFTTFAGGKFSEMTKDDNYFYLTEISTDSEQARVYSIPETNLVEQSKTDDMNIRNTETIRYSASVNPSEGYHFVYAIFDDGVFSTMENGNSVIKDYIYDNRAVERFNNKHFTLNQLITINFASFRNKLILTVIGILIILSITFFLKRRNRVAYMIILWETMLIIVFGAIIYFFVIHTFTNDWGELVKFSCFTIEDLRSELGDMESDYKNTENYYRSSSYRDVVERLRHVSEEYADGDIFANVLCITGSNSDYHVIAAGTGLDNCNLLHKYGRVGVQLADKVNQTGNSSYEEVLINGSYYLLICSGDKNDPRPTSMIMAIIPQSINEYDLESYVYIIGFVVIAFIVTSVLGVIILLLQSGDLRKISNSMFDVSQGNSSITKPESIGEDISDMWSGLLDIDRSIKNLNYVKYRTFEAYYKFAPKSVEKLLNKSSITEVINGDMNPGTGTIISINTDTNHVLLKFIREKDYSKFLFDSKGAELLSLVSQYQEEDALYKISSTSDFSLMQLVAPEKNRSVVKMGIALSNTYRNEGYASCEFMHYTDYYYGVTISGSEAVQFMVSMENMKMKSSLPLLSKLKLALVITNSVYERELEKPNCRYIGYWDIGTEKNIDLYEVLDAYEDDERHRREDTRELFNEALKLFYENNFYLARNTFAKILKVNQSDTVARWYLFTCENYLDGTNKTINHSLCE